jgi:hypothetical protein
MISELELDLEKFDQSVKIFEDNLKLMEQFGESNKQKKPIKMDYSVPIIPNVTSGFYFPEVVFQTEANNINHEPFSDFEPGELLVTENVLSPPKNIIRLGGEWLNQLNKSDVISTQQPEEPIVEPPTLIQDKNIIQSSSQFIEKSTINPYISGKSDAISIPEEPIAEPPTLIQDENILKSSSQFVEKSLGDPYISGKSDTISIPEEPIAEPPTLIQDENILKSSSQFIEKSLGDQYILNKSDIISIPTETLPIVQSPPIIRDDDNKSNFIESTSLNDDFMIGQVSNETNFLGGNLFEGNIPSDVLAVEESKQNYMQTPFDPLGGGFYTYPGSHSLAQRIGSSKTYEEDDYGENFARKLFEKQHEMIRPPNLFDEHQLGDMFNTEIFFDQIKKGGWVVEDPSTPNIDYIKEEIKSTDILPKVKFIKTLYKVLKDEYKDDLSESDLQQIHKSHKIIFDRESDKRDSEFSQETKEAQAKHPLYEVYIEKMTEECPKITADLTEKFIASYKGHLNQLINRSLFNLHSDISSNNKIHSPHKVTDLYEKMSIVQKESYVKDWGNRLARALLSN